MYNKIVNRKYKTIAIFLIALVVFSLTIVLLLNTYSHRRDLSNKVEATDSQSNISSEAGWSLGSYSSSILDLVSQPGSLALVTGDTIPSDNFTASANLWGQIGPPPGVPTGTGPDSTIDGSIDPPTVWLNADTGLYVELIIDMGEVLSIDGVKIYVDDLSSWEPDFAYSVNGVDYTEYATARHFGVENYDEAAFASAESARYLRVSITQTLVASMLSITEVVPYVDTNTATHTTAPTQIDGQEGSADKDLIEWETFTPTQTTPANTSIEYQFRTSANGVDGWTDWSSAQEYSGTPLDLTGLTSNRYLQVKSTLSNTDGVSTPQIDDYTINFHNNEAPDQPTAQTAVIE